MGGIGHLDLDPQRSNQITDPPRRGANLDDHPIRLKFHYQIMNRPRDRRQGLVPVLTGFRMIQAGNTLPLS